MEMTNEEILTASSVNQSLFDTQGSSALEDYFLDKTIRGWLIKSPITSLVTSCRTLLSPPWNGILLHKRDLLRDTFVQIMCICNYKLMQQFSLLCIIYYCFECDLQTEVLPRLVQVTNWFLAPVTSSRTSSRAACSQSRC